jgi:hypothetical protein
MSHRKEDREVLITLEPGSRGTSWCRAMRETPIPNNLRVAADKRSRVTGYVVERTDGSTTEVSPTPLTAMSHSVSASWAGTDQGAWIRQSMFVRPTTVWSCAWTCRGCVGGDVPGERGRQRHEAAP